MRKSVFILVTAFALAVAAPASASSGLSGWWPFYEGSGATTRDLSGNHNNGTINGASWTTGYFGPALSFNGNGQNVDVPDDTSLEPATSVTVTAYVKELGSPGDFKYIVAKGGFGCATGAYGLYSGPNGGLMFYVDHPDGSTFARSPDAGPGVWDGKWHFVVGTYDGSNVHLYVDGTEIGSGTPNTGPITYGGTTSSDLFIGHYEGCPEKLDFVGSIDEPTVWARALSTTQIRFTYQALAALHGWVTRLPSFPVN